MKKTQQKINSLIQYLQNTNQDINDISAYSLINIFNIVQKGQLSYYNICKTFNFKDIDKISKNYYKQYIIQSNDTLNKISFKEYGTIQAWWIICKFNNIKNPFEKLKEGQILKLPTLGVISNILSILQE